MRAAIPAEDKAEILIFLVAQYSMCGILTEVSGGRLAE